VARTGECHTSATPRRSGQHLSCRLAPEQGPVEATTSSLLPRPPGSP